MHKAQFKKLTCECLRNQEITQDHAKNILKADDIVWLGQSMQHLKAHILLSPAYPQNTRIHRWTLEQCHIHASVDVISLLFKSFVLLN